MGWPFAMMPEASAPLYRSAEYERRWAAASRVPSGQRGARHLMAVAIATGRQARSSTVGDEGHAPAERDGFVTGEVTGWVTGPRGYSCNPNRDRYGGDRGRNKALDRAVKITPLNNSHDQAGRGPRGGMGDSMWTAVNQRGALDESFSLFACCRVGRVGGVLLVVVSSPGRSANRFDMLNTVEGALSMRLKNPRSLLLSLLFREGQEQR